MTHVTTPTQAELNKILFGLAEERLGRKMTKAELRMDVADARSVHEQGKQRLARAIRAEMRSVIKRRKRGLVARMAVTNEMLDALEWIRKQGERHAKAELEKTGLDAVAYADKERHPAVFRKAITRLGPMLNGINIRIDTAAADDAIALSLGETTAGLFIDALAKQAPGALDAASRLVSETFTAGLSEGFAPSLDIIPGWGYTAVHDEHTCPQCRVHDGEQYDTLSAALAVLPNFGPNPDCYGEGRCRCRLVPRVD